MPLNKNTALRILLAIIAIVALVYCYPAPDQQRYYYKVGGVWNYSLLTAPFDLPIPIDSVKANLQADSIRREFAPVYTRDDQVHHQFVKAAKALPVDRLSWQGQALFRQMYADFASAYRTGVIDNESYNKIHGSDKMRIRLYYLNENKVGEPLDTVTYLSPESKYAKWSTRRDEAPITWRNDPLLSQYLDSLYKYLKPNIVYDKKHSDELLGNDLNHIYVSKGNIQMGGRIIDKGETITPQLYALLRAYEAKMAETQADSKGSTMLRIGGEVLFAALMIGALMRFLYVSRRTLYDNNKAMVCIFSLIVGFAIFAALASRWMPAAIYIVPFAIIPIVLNVFFDSRVGVFVSMVTLMLCLPFSQFPMEFITLQFTAVVAALYSIKEFSRRSQLLTAAGYVLAAYVVCYVAGDLLLNGNVESLSIRMVGLFAINAVLISIAYLFIFVLEKIFGFISVVTLVELSDINNPILRELSQECPGTFQHSMAVSTLASDAAIKVGANVQLIRTGALYHDIGKLNNPAFFTENQHGVNPHSTLDPTQSAKIIIRHVTDGAKRADKGKLPKVIKDFILEHHGKGVAKYFYNTYCNDHPDEEVDIAQFQYPGPNPQTRETSILMMADAVEAASRSLTEYTVEAITALVNKIIDGQIADGLHRDAPITFRDVTMIKESFIKRLRTIYHARVAYPERKNG